MSDQTKTLTESAAAALRETLAAEFTAAYREARTKHHARTDRLDAAVKAIENTPQAFNRPDTPQNFITGLEREVDHDLNVEIGRQRLADALDATHKQIAELARQITWMSGNEQYDEEIASGDTASMQAALTGLRVNLAALRGLTRHATPETRP